MRERFERLKEELYGMGTDYIDEFLGYEFDYDLPKSKLDKAMEEAYQSRTLNEIEEYYREYGIK